MIAGTLDIEQQDVLKAVNLYTQALVLLDQYDHQSLEKPEGSSPIYRITYKDCREMVNHTQMQKFVRLYLIGKIEELELLINRFLVLVRPGPFLLFLNSA